MMICPQPPSSKPTPLPIAMQLKAVRLRLGLSQAEFARAFALTRGGSARLGAGPPPTRPSRSRVSPRDCSQS